MTSNKKYTHKKPTRLLIKKQTAYMVLFIYLLLTIYTEIPLYLSDSFYIPSFLTILSGPLLLISCRMHLYKRDALFFLKLCMILFLTAVLSPGREFLLHKFTGVIQTGTSVFLGILLFKLMGFIDKDRLSKSLFILTIIFFSGTFLEITGLIKGLSDSFREFVYLGDYKVYDNDLRDIAITGFSRPKFFTSEPSLLAIGFLAFLNSWLILSFNRRNFLLAVLLTVLMLYAVGSPILLISMVITILTILINARNAFSRISIAAITLAFVLIVLSILFITTDLWLSLAHRFSSSILHAQTYTITSENLRMVFPYITMLDILRASPLFGTGISGKEVIEVYSTLPLDPVFAFGNNNFATLFIYLGFAGSGLFIFVFNGWLREMGVENVFFLALILAGFSQSMGAFESPRFWGYVFLFIGVTARHSETLRKGNSKDEGS